MNNFYINLFTFVFIVILAVIQGCSTTVITPSTIIVNTPLSNYTCTDSQLELVTDLIEGCTHPRDPYFCTNKAFVIACDPL